MKKEGTTMHHGESDMMHIMHEMNRKMETMKMKGDVDHDFAEMMIVHHQAAIDMAQQELDAGHDSMLRNLAEKIIEDQTREIREMEQWLKEQH